jgi:hypothetical protein
MGVSATHAKTSRPSALVNADGQWIAVEHEIPVKLTPENFSDICSDDLPSMMPMLPTNKVNWECQLMLE